MEPIGICGGGLVALFLFLVAIFGSAILAGGIAIALAKLGVTVDARLKSTARGRSGRMRRTTTAQETIIHRPTDRILSTFALKFPTQICVHPYSLL